MVPGNIEGVESSWNSYWKVLLGVVLATGFVAPLLREVDLHESPKFSTDPTLRQQLLQSEELGRILQSNYDSSAGLPPSFDEIAFKCGYFNQGKFLYPFGSLDGKSDWIYTPKSSSGVLRLKKGGAVTFLINQSFEVITVK
jgi:hypothetical protein